MQREYITAISITRGLVLLIDLDGEIRAYRQRGINTLTQGEINKEVQMGRLISTWETYNELPKNYSISFEEPRIMGRAVATYQLVLDKERNRKKRNT